MNQEDYEFILKQLTKAGTDNQIGLPELVHFANIDDLIAQDWTKSVFYARAYDELAKRFQLIKKSITNAVTQIEDQKLAYVESLDAVQSKIDTECLFNLGSTIYARGKLANKDRVIIKIGSDVMIEYSLAEAAIIFEKLIKKASVELDKILLDSESCTARTTICNVNTRRIYNYCIENGQKEIAQKICQFLQT